MVIRQLVDLGTLAREKHFRRAAKACHVSQPTLSRAIEEVFLVQNLVRAGMHNNNVDTCACVCHSPTGYGLSNTAGTFAGAQDFKSVATTDVILVIGASPPDGHPVFASQTKKRLRQGAKLIFADSRRIDLVKSPRIKAQQHLPLKLGTDVALISAIAHVIVPEGLVAEEYVRTRCDLAEFESWVWFLALRQNSPEYTEQFTCVAARGQNNVQGPCDMGSFPHEYLSYRRVEDAYTREVFKMLWGVELAKEPGLRIPNMLDEAVGGHFLCLYVQGEDTAQSDPNTQHVTAGLAAMECLVIQDLSLNEAAKYAHVFLPGASFSEKDGTFTNAERRINRVRKVEPLLGGKDEWRITAERAAAMGYEMLYRDPSDVMDEVARLTPIMHIDRFVHGKGRFVITEYIPTEELTGPRYPLILTTGRILSQYNVGAQTRRVEISERMEPGVVYTTFHYASTGANVITTEFSDWATNCPEYNVTAVEGRKTNHYSAWQERNRDEDLSLRRIMVTPAHAAV